MKYPNHGDFIHKYNKGNKSRPLTPNLLNLMNGFYMLIMVSPSLHESRGFRSSGSKSPSSFPTGNTTRVIRRATGVDRSRDQSQVWSRNVEVVDVRSYSRVPKKKNHRLTNTPHEHLPPY